VTGLIITTVGFIIATRLFGIKYDMVAFSHGRIGVAILVLIYSQVCNPQQQSGHGNLKLWQPARARSLCSLLQLMLTMFLVLILLLQLLMGLVRPAASAPTMRRHAWDVGHTVLGRSAMMLGILNAILGIYIFVTGYGGGCECCLGFETGRSTV
jgi:hypothetical protein